MMAGMARGRSAETALAGKLMWIGIALIAFLIIGSFVFSALAALFKLVIYVALLVMLVGGATLLVRSFLK